MNRWETLLSQFFCKNAKENCVSHPVRKNNPLASSFFLFLFSSSSIHPRTLALSYYMSPAGGGEAK